MALFPLPVQAFTGVLLAFSLDPVGDAELAGDELLHCRGVEFVAVIADGFFRAPGEGQMFQLVEEHR